MNEAFLQYVWQHQLLDSSLVSVDGQPVVVERAGMLNENSGPDFIDARLLINGVRWAGNVEVHIKSSDWDLHHHTDDKAYNNVILHVVYVHDKPIFLENGQQPPVVELKNFISEVVWNNYETLSNPPESLPIPCASRIGEISDFRLKSYLDRLLVERLQQKSGRIKQMLSESKGSWETCCYWSVAHYFGGKANSFAFELLAKSTPLTLLARYKGNRTKVEAILFGQAGLLDGCFEDEYPRMLQVEYEALRKGFGLTPISNYLWKFFRLRPSSFPTLRISQFASLVSNSTALFSRLLNCDSAKDILALFDSKSSDYWTSHYHFDKPSKVEEKRVGRMLADTLVVNAWAPLLFEYGVQHGSQDLKDRAVELLGQVQPEKNNVMTMWSDCGVKAASAADSQALLQLYNNYCKDRRCLNCQLGYCLIKN